MKDISKNYHILTAHERFQLAIKAMARDDKVEFDRLNRSCPVKGYRMLDAAYIDRHKALLKLFSSFLIAMSEISGKLAMLVGFKEMLTYLVNVIENDTRLAYIYGQADANSKSNRSRAEEIEEMNNLTKDFINKALHKIREAIMSKAKLDFQAFEAVCNEKMSLDIETVIAGIGASEILQWLDREELKKAPEVKSDDEMREKYIDCWEDGIK